MAEDKYTRADQKRFTLRMDEELFEKVKASAKENKRSIGKEIEFVLDQYFENDQKESD